jgi:hypothetical protein
MTIRQRRRRATERRQLNYQLPKAQKFVFRIAGVYGGHPGIVCRAYSAQAKVLMGFPEAGKRLLEEAVAHARGAKNAHAVAWALGVAGHILQLQHDPAATARFASDAIEIARENRFPQWLALGERCKGWAIFRLGELEVGLTLQLEGIKRWYDTGAVLHTTQCEIILAKSFLGMGQVTLARSHLDTAHAHRARYGDDYLGADIDRLEALLQQHQDASVEIVERHLVGALDTARRQSARLLELRAATTFAKYWPGGTSATRPSISSPPSTAGSPRASTRPI